MLSFSGCRVAATLLLIAVASCGQAPSGDGEKIRTIESTLTQVIEPTFADMESTAKALQTAVAAVVVDPTAVTLDAARVAWRAARVPWKNSETFGFGPAMDLRLVVAIDQSPIDPLKVDEEINGVAQLSSDYVEQLGANRKGFHAMEYLLFRAQDEAAVLPSLTSDSAAVRRRELLKAYSENFIVQVATLRTAWLVAGGHRDLMLTAGASNPVYGTVKSVIDTLVNESVFVSEFLIKTRLGKPMGTATGGVPQPALEESGPSDNSIADLRGSVESVRNMYLGSRDGTVGVGLTVLVAEQNPATDLAMQDALRAALAAINAVPQPFATSVVQMNPALDQALLAVRELKRLYATEVVAALGVTLRFNDNDGD